MVLFEELVIGKMVTSRTTDKKETKKIKTKRIIEKISHGLIRILIIN